MLLDVQFPGVCIMSLSEELDRLGALHERGVLSGEEFARAKARVLGGAAEATAPGLRAINALRRSRADRWLGGVCGGIARVTGVESWIWRLLFALLALCAGTGAVLYVLMWILIPADPLIPGQTPGHPQAG
jgi:phage shock protein C